MRIRLLQALALVALLHTVTPLLDPAQVGLAELEEHYGETVTLEGRVTAVEPNGEVVRLSLATDDGEATVLTRASPVPVGANVTLRGQPTPGRAGPVVWADGRLAMDRAAGGPEPVPLARALAQAPRLAEAPIAVRGTWNANEEALIGAAGALPVERAGIAPAEGPVLLWGRLVYEPSHASYELEATGWRPWSPPRR